MPALESDDRFEEGLIARNTSEVHLRWDWRWSRDDSRSPTESARLPEMKILMIAPLGHEVDLLTYPIGHDVQLPGIRIRRTSKIPGVRKVKIGPSLLKIPLDALLTLKTFFALLRGHYDLVHTHEEAGLWGVAFARWFGLPVIYDMHSSLPQQLHNFQFTRSRLLITLFQLMESWILRHADAVITICPDLFDHVATLLPEKGSVLIENVVDYGLIFGETDSSEEIKARYKLRGKKVALYTGTFEPYQGLDILIQGMGRVTEQFPSVVFLLVGGHPQQVDTYRKMAVESHVESRVIFTGQVSPEDVESYIRCADMLLSPRISGTNTPLKIYAYLRSGVPVVATRLLTHTQVLNDQVAVLTDPSSEGFAAGVVRLLKDTKAARRIATAAQKYGMEHFSYTVYLEKCRKVLEKAMGAEA